MELSCLESFLGKEKYNIQKKNENDEVGIVRGLAWTSVGGDTLQIEVNIMPGKGDFMLTGQLGGCDEGVGAGGESVISVLWRPNMRYPTSFSATMIYISISRREPCPRTDPRPELLWLRRCCLP